MAAAAWAGLVSGFTCYTTTLASQHVCFLLGHAYVFSVSLTHWAVGLLLAGTMCILHCEFLKLNQHAQVFFF